MNTLIKLVMAVVLQITGGDLAKDTVTTTVSEVKTTVCQQELLELNPHYIITRDEVLSHVN